MTTYTTEGMPKGYTLIRYGIFQWGWKCEDPETGCKHHSLSKKMTANGAQRYAWDHLRELSILSNQTKPNQQNEN